MSWRRHILVAVALAFGPVVPVAKSAVPVFEDGVVQTRCLDVPVKAFGGTWIYCGAPDLMDDVPLQKGNVRLREKVLPKPAQDLKGNFFGVDTTRMPCLSENMGLCEEAVHLIDGDVQTCWLSAAQTRCDMQPVTVRIDLAKETEIAKVVLRKRPLLPDSQRRKTDRQPAPDACEVGRGLPVEMSVAVACDAYRWQDVFTGELRDSEDKESFEVSFTPRRAKQIRLSATRLRQVERCLYALSLAEIEILDTAGRNVALVSYGTTIAVNATFSTGLPLAQQKALWPVQWDLGVKWVRVGYHDDPINWHRVEREKGRLEVDPVADAAVTACHAHGQSVIMCLNYGNRLYSGPEKRALPQMPEWNYCTPKPPTTQEALVAWERYVTFMCRHFRGRVHTFEIWNEWNISEYWGDEVDVDAYCEIVRRTIPIIRRHAPGCKVMLGSTCGYFGGMAFKTPEQIVEFEKKDVCFIVWKRFAKDVDAIGYHPFYNPKPGSLLNYGRDIEAFRAWLVRHGFRGTLHASEWNINGRATSVDPKDARDCWCGIHTQSETAKAKEVLQQMVRHAGFGIPSCFCEMYHAFYAQTELSLLKGSLCQAPISPVQPTVSYYALRNAATMMDGFEPADFRVELSRAGLAGKCVAAYAFACGGRRGAAVWYEDDRRDDGYRHVTADLTLPFAVQSLWAYDFMNGVRQRLDFSVEDGRTVVRDLLVGDVPVFVAEGG